MALTMTLIGFAAGSLPLSLWLGRLALGVDVRDFGPDRNPGDGVTSRLRRLRPRAVARGRACPSVRRT